MLRPAASAAWGPALGSARESHACLEVARAFGYVDALDPALEDKLQHVTATLVRLVDGPR